MGHDIARKHKEKVDGQITVVDEKLVIVAFAKHLESMHDQHHDGRNATKRIQNEKVLFRIYKG